MKTSSFFQPNNKAIIDSIHLYKKGLMEDINLTLRLTENNHTHVTKPVEWSNNLLIFEAPMDRLDYVMYAKNTKLKVIFVSKSALFTTHINICKNYKKNNCLYYVGQIIEPIVKKQQRESFRLDLTMDIEYQILPDHDVLPARFNIKEIPFQKAICVNISTGGICISCNEQLRSHKRLLLSFTMLDIPLILHGEVLHMGEKTDVGTYLHRLRFYNLSTVDYNQLNQLIFQKQRLQLKRS